MITMYYFIKKLLAKVFSLITIIIEIKKKTLYNTDTRRSSLAGALNGAILTIFDNLEQSNEIWCIV